MKLLAETSNWSSSPGLRRRSEQAFTLMEVMVGAWIVAILVVANLSLVQVCRIMNSKDAERGIVSGYMQHYMELVRALPFSQVQTNQALSGLCNGQDGTPKIILPASQDWISISDTNYQTFHPDLLWLTNRQPEMRVRIDTTFNGGVAHDKHISMEVRWDPPLGRGSKLSRRLDMVRVKDW